MRKFILLFFILTSSILLKAEKIVFKDKQIIKGKILKVEEELIYCGNGENLLIIEREIVEEILDEMGKVDIKVKEGWINYNKYSRIIKLNLSNYQEKIPAVKKDMKADQDPIYSLIDFSLGKSFINNQKAKDSVQGAFYLGRENLYFGLSLNFMLYNERNTFIPKDFPYFSAGFSMIKKEKLIDLTAELKMLRIISIYGYYWYFRYEEIWTPLAKVGLRKELFEVVIIKADAGLYPYKSDLEHFLNLGIGVSYPFR